MGGAFEHLPCSKDCSGVKTLGPVRIDAVPVLNNLINEFIIIIEVPRKKKEVSDPGWGLGKGF